MTKIKTAVSVVFVGVMALATRNRLRQPLLIEVTG